MSDTEGAPEGETESQRIVRATKSVYFNALQVKYGYAVTCHKAQGGQWSDVYIDLGYISPEAMGMDFTDGFIRSHARYSPPVSLQSDGRNQITIRPQDNDCPAA